MFCRERSYSCNGPLGQILRDHTRLLASRGHHRSRQFIKIFSLIIFLFFLINILCSPFSSHSTIRSIGSLVPLVFASPNIPLVSAARVSFVFSHRRRTRFFRFYVRSHTRTNAHCKLCLLPFNCSPSVGRSSVTPFGSGRQRVCMCIDHFTLIHTSVHLLAISSLVPHTVFRTSPPLPFCFSFKTSR